MRKGGVTLSLLVVQLVGTGTGALVGLILGGSISHEVVIALVAGLTATFAAALVRNELVHRQIGVGPCDTTVPSIVIAYAAFASVIGGLAGLELAILLDEPFPVWIGTLAGLLSSILTGLLIVTFHAALAHGEKMHHA